MTLKHTLYIILTLNYFYTHSQSANINLLGKWDVDSITNNNNSRYNDCWGWEYNGKEYAVIGSSYGSHIVDVSTPNSPIEVDFIKGGYSHEDVTHRDYKTHKNHLFMVCDQGTTSTLQIADLSFLPDSVHIVYDSNNLLINAHNIFIDTLHDILYQCGGSNLFGFNSFSAFDISTPSAPTLLVDFKNDISWWETVVGSVHDVFVKDNIIYTNDGGAMHVIDFSNQSSPILLGEISSYPDQGYNHSGWLANDDTTYIMLDETNGKKIKILDVSNPSNILVTDLVKSRKINTVAHNSFIKGNYAYTSYYGEGVYIYDIRNRNNVTTAGFYDTYPQHEFYPSFVGCWGVYPFLPSGNILASDRQTGLYVLNFNENFAPKIDTILVDSNNLCSGGAIKFTHNSLRSDSLQWYFEGGTPSYSNIKEPEISYLTPGVFDVTLIIWNSHGTDTLTLNNFIGVSPSPCVKPNPKDTILIKNQCSGTLLDPGGFSGEYYNLNNILFKISNEKAARVKLLFKFIDIDDYSFPCNEDYINIYDENHLLIEKYCNSNLPSDTIFIDGSSTFIEFKSNAWYNMNNQNGFVLEWYCEISPDSIINIYPNPVISGQSISLPLANNFILYDVIGNVIKKGKHTSNFVTDNLASGMYLLKINSETYRLIVK